MFAKTLEDKTQVALLVNEEVQMRGRNGEAVRVCASEMSGPVLVTFRTDAYGRMWLGAWRRAPLGTCLNDVRPGKAFRRSAELCRLACDSRSARVFRVCRVCGTIPVIHSEEIVVHDKTSAYVVSRSWFSRTNRERRARRRS